MGELINGPTLYGAVKPGPTCQQQCTTIPARSYEQQRFLRYMNATIDVHKAWIPSLQRENDVMLMDTFKTKKPGQSTLDHLPNK
eukprot:342147-Ditylum_brightwellii.AAC.1